MADIDRYGGTMRASFDATGFFRTEKTGNRWWLVDPEGHGFLSIGLNHADETNLKYPHNHDIWRQKYGSRTSWIRDGLVKDLREWGFNTIGWTQEYVSGDWGVALDWFGDPIDLGHSREWAVTDFQVADMPYVQQLRIAEIEDWNGEPIFPDVYSQEFENYCEYLARAVCLEQAENPNLVGYFLVDIPAWLPHASGADFSVLSGLDRRARNIKVYDVAYRYYETVTKHVRWADPNHLILGDRYNGNKGIPKSVLAAAKWFVDVFSVQYFPGAGGAAMRQMRDDLARWQQVIDKPVLIADIGNWAPTTLNPNRVGDLPDQAARARHYAESISAVLREPWLAGWHWCAYVENLARGWGLKDPYDEPYQDLVDDLAAFNRAAYDIVTSPGG